MYYNFCNIYKQCKVLNHYKWRWCFFGTSLGGWREWLWQCDACVSDADTSWCSFSAATILTFINCYLLSIRPCCACAISIWVTRFCIIKGKANNKTSEEKIIGEKKKNDPVQMARTEREAELEEKLTELTGEFERLRKDMVSTNRDTDELVQWTGCFIT